MSESSLAALRVVLDHREVDETIALRREVDETIALRRKLAEAEAACPAIFAEIGDMFEHRRDERMQNYELDVFEYVGRTAGSSVSHATRHGPVTVAAGWLIFKHIDGSGFGDYYGALNGGMRDVINAWPESDYWVYDDEGEYDENVFCLPPDKCYCFRKLEEYMDEEEDDEEEDDEEGAPSPTEIDAATRTIRFGDLEDPLNTSCPISHENFEDDQTVTQLNHCSHIFNTDSIQRWFETGHQCPVCRHDIRTEPRTSAPANDQEGAVLR
jgi:hypothetical protein